MLKKTIQYTDYDGSERTEDFYFYLSKRDLTELVLLHEGGMEGLQNWLKDIVASRDPKKLLPALQKFIALSYGVRTEVDGHIRFKRSEQITDDFVSSAAYDQIVFEMIADGSGKTMGEFMIGILPPDLAAQLKDLELPEVEQYTTEQLLEMSDDEFVRACGSDIRKLNPRHLAIAMERRTRHNVTA